MTTKRIEEVYNSYAGVYDLLFGKTLQGGRDKVPKLLDLFPGARLLDVGVGTGLSIPTWNRNVEIVGIDLSEKMLTQAERRVRSLGLRNVRLRKMDASALEFPDHSFDRVQAAYFISTVPDPVKVIREMKRVCRPGGYLVFCNHFQNENPVVGLAERILSPICYHLGFRTDLKLEEVMQSSGLEIDMVENIDIFGLWKAVRCVNA